MESKKKSVLIVLNSCKDIGEKISETYFPSIEKFANEHFTEFYDRVKLVIASQKQFGNKEICALTNKSVRRKDVIILASGSNVDGMSINDHLLMLLATIDSAKTGSAAYITVIMPYLSYCRSDKKDKSRMPIMAKNVCKMIKNAGADRLVSIDLHSGQIQGFFEGPYDNLYAIKYLCEAIQKDFASDLKESRVVAISPDAGGLKRVNAWAERLQIPHTFMVKERDHSTGKIEKHELAKKLDLIGKIVLIIDDMADTLGTITSAIQMLKDQGAAQIIVVVTHGIFSGLAFDNLEKSDIDAIYVTNSLPQTENVKRSKKIRVVDVSDLICQVILKNIKGESVSNLFLQ